MAEHGHESAGGSKKKESAEKGGGKHDEWMKLAGRGLAALGITYTIANLGPAILQAASVALAPYLGVAGIGAALWWYLSGKKGGEKKPAKAGGGGHH